MAGGSLLTLFDDIATLLDDIATMTKVATRKTAGVLGDDLALNAEQVTGVRPERELPVIWAVAKGSVVNKLILIPAALAINAVFAPAVTWLLMAGGLFLAYEGFEKVLHKLFHVGEDKDAPKHKKGELSPEKARALIDPKVDIVAMEKARVKGAIRTDFILSAEILVITLGTVTDESFGVQLGVLSVIAALMVVFVYGLVAGIVKLDDAGKHLVETSPDTGFKNAFGLAMLSGAPKLMKLIGIVGTIAMFLVGGGILVHGIHALEDIQHKVEALSVPGFLQAILPTVYIGLVGVVAGAIVFAIVTPLLKLRKSA